MWVEIPKECLWIILSNLCFDESFSVRVVCRRWRDIYLSGLVGGNWFPMKGNVPLIKCFKSGDEVFHENGDGWLRKLPVYIQDNESDPCSSTLVAQLLWSSSGGCWPRTFLPNDGFVFKTLGLDFGMCSVSHDVEQGKMYLFLAPSELWDEGFDVWRARVTRKIGQASIL